MSCQKNLDTKIKWQKKYMLNHLNKAPDIYILSAKEDLSNNIYGWNTIDDQSSPPVKYIKFFKNMTINYDYYFFIDDDTFVNINRFIIFMDKIDNIYKNDPNIKLYIGYTPCINNSKPKYNINNRIYMHNSSQKIFSIMSGGAGFVINKKLYTDIQNFINQNQEEDLIKLSFDKGKVYGDVFIGKIIHIFADVVFIYNKNFNMYNHLQKKINLYDFIKKK